jgi:hypothetical protein
VVEVAEDQVQVVKIVDRLVEEEEVLVVFSGVEVALRQ